LLQTNVFLLPPLIGEKNLAAAAEKLGDGATAFFLVAITWRTFWRRKNSAAISDHNTNFDTKKVPNI